MSRAWAGAAVLAGLVLAGAARAAPGAPPGASSCAGCHGAGPNGPVPVIQGRPAGEIAAALEAFRRNERPATVMNRIAPGFTPAESQAIALWLSRQPAP